MYIHPGSIISPEFFMLDQAKSHEQEQPSTPEVTPGRREADLGHPVVPPLVALTENTENLIISKQYNLPEFELV